MKSYRIDGYRGKYNIKCRDGIISPSYLIRDENGEVITFTSNYAARKFIETLPRESDHEMEETEEKTENEANI